MPEIKLIKDDITRLKVDVIVNAANSKLAGGGGVDGAIHKAAGKEQLLEATSKLGGCPMGEARITPGFKLTAKFIIHTVGPVWTGGSYNEELYLASAYRESLLLAKENKLKSIAFPNISTGVYGYPKDKAAEIAIKTIDEYYKHFDMPEVVYFVCFDEENFNIYKDLLKI